MKYISFLIKPASSACDMRCSYCFYRDVADHRAHAVRERMSHKTMRALVDRALGLGEDAQVTFAFQGGEPTLAGLDFFREFTGYVEERRTRQSVSYALQTNGHTLTPEWAEFFREHGFLVGVSVDAYRELHDSLRKDIVLGPTHARVMESVGMLRDAGVDFNVLTVLSAQLARHPQLAFKFYKREKIDYVQFIPCLAGFDGEGAEHALTPRALFSFYRTFFDLWLREAREGHVISVGLFDNVMQLSLGQYPQACGMLGRCAPQFVVESNGDRSLWWRATGTSTRATSTRSTSTAAATSTRTLLRRWRPVGPCARFWRSPGGRARRAQTAPSRVSATETVSG